MPDTIEPARKGKIGRLPWKFRVEVCERIHNGETAGKIAAWLNGLPEVLKVLDEHFKEEPVTVQNLSEWRKGGYQDWLRKRDEIDRTKELADYALKLGKAAGGGISDGSAAILGGRIMATIEAAGDFVNPMHVEMVSMLRKGDHEAIKRQQAGTLLDLKKEQIDLDRKRYQRQTCELFVKWYADARAKEIVESRDSNSDKIEQLGQKMFGEDW
jgi:hypothetical protein